MVLWVFANLAPWMEVVPVVDEQVLIYDPFEEYTVGNKIAV